jgi:hypothetical protein
MKKEKFSIGPRGAESLDLVEERLRPTGPLFRYFALGNRRRCPMSINLFRAGLPGLAIMLIPSGESLAHEIVGNRFFPATLSIDDPGVNDELSLPTFDSFKTGDAPPVRQRDISGEFSRRITEDFAISFGSTYTFLGPMDPTAPGANGFQTSRPRSNIGSSRFQNMSS